MPEPGVGFPVRTLGQPVVEPRWDTRDPGDVLIETAKALGGNAASAMPFENMAAAVKESFRSVHALQAGSTVDADFEAFYRKVTAAGGWWHAPQPAPAGAAAEGRGQQGRQRRRSIQFVIPQQPVAARTFAGDAQQMPFMLHLYPSAAFADGRAAHLPWLQEMPDPMTTVMWGSWVEINPETAHKLDIHEGDILTIASPQGSIELPAFLYPGLRPDVIAIPVGQGHTQYGRYAAEPRREPAADQRVHTRSGIRGGCADRRQGERGEDGTERSVDSIRRIGCSRDITKHPLHR